MNTRHLPTALLSLFLSSVVSFAQVSYSYDQAGNRTGRVTTRSVPKAKKAETTDMTAQEAMADKYSEPFFPYYEW